jgi:hypothetical protein
VRIAALLAITGQPAVAGAQVRTLAFFATNSVRRLEPLRDKWHLFRDT